MKQRRVKSTMTLERPIRILNGFVFEQNPKLALVHNMRSVNAQTRLSDLRKIFEPAQDKTYKCAPSEDLDQPGHPPRLIRVFAVRRKEAWVPSYPLRTQRRLIRLGGPESSLDAHSFCWFCRALAHLVFRREIINSIIIIFLQLDLSSQTRNI